jgi:hypothetical protein
MRVASLAILMRVVGCASPSPPQKPFPYRYITDAPSLMLDANHKEPS